MRGGQTTIVTVLVALLLAVGLAACGGGDSSTATEAGQGRAESTPSQGAAQPSDAKGGDEGKSGSSEVQSKSSGPSVSAFTPKQHKDSGGGSTQFKVKGGDNSVQEFGDEAAGSELDAAATALHNFLDARAEGNWAAACEYLSNSIHESFEKLAARATQVEDSSCAGILATLTNPAAKASIKAEAARADVRSLRIDGEQAFILYTGLDGSILATPMANEGGDWKVAGLAGTQLN